ncbi:MAG TPA: hypothetical protein VN607_05285 [Gemmatimonadaceae bacterium]|nr:hypothetical protein [Gemmatimonadaceae bacterium]
MTPVRLVLDIGTSGFGAMLTSPFVERHAGIAGQRPSSSAHSAPASAAWPRAAWPGWSSSG